MLIYLLAIFSVYFIFLILLILGWQEAVSDSDKDSTPDQFVSVVVAVRNEENTLPDLIRTLARQTHPHNNFEIILIDDHSTDQTAALISKLKHDYPFLAIRTRLGSGTGKKKALTDGIAMATGEIILTTDADCLLPANWIQGMLKSFRSNTNMVVGMVKIESNNKFFGTLQFLEFASVMGSGISFLGWRLPVMCNGASLAFRKKVWQTVNGYEGNFQIASGDDEFLMRKIEKKYPGTIELLSQQDCVVRTHPKKSMTEFIQQRLRWAGKWKLNDSPLTRFSAVFVLITQISWLILLILLIASTNDLWFVLVITKILLEVFFLWRICKYLQEDFPVVAFILLQVLYPLYVIYVGVLSQFKTSRWKDRESTLSR